jgi:hypothetical protein
LITACILFQQHRISKAVLGQCCKKTVSKVINYLSIMNAFKMRTENWANNVKLSVFFNTFVTGLKTFRPYYRESRIII